MSAYTAAASETARESRGRNFPIEAPIHIGTEHLGVRAMTQRGHMVLQFDGYDAYRRLLELSPDAEIGINGTTTTMENFLGTIFPAARAVYFSRDEFELAEFEFPHGMRVPSSLL
ncbi:MAG: hypothetical protein V1659_02215 [Candidatus Woesearchaeota archaeon]